jgi:hypothetical protein
MLDDPNFVPFIRTSTWSGIADCFTCPLLKDDGHLVIAYGLLGSSSVTYLTQAGRKASELTDVEIHIRAIRNMLKVPGRPNWQEHKLGGESYVMRVGNELVASGVLNAKGLLRLNDFLDAPSYYVAIPCLFTMVAATHPGLLSGIVKGLYEDAVRDSAGPISDRLMVVNKGQLSSYAGAPPASSSGEPADQAGQVLVLTQGLAAVWVVTEHAKGAVGDGTSVAFVSGVKRRLAKEAPALVELVASAESGVDEAAASVRRTKEAIGGIDAMAGVLRPALGAAAFDELSRALIGAATDLGQSGTGFFGIGRKLPDDVRVVVRALSGVLGLANATPARPAP